MKNVVIIVSSIQELFYFALAEFNFVVVRYAINILKFIMEKMANLINGIVRKKEEMLVNLNIDARFYNLL